MDASGLVGMRMLTRYLRVSRSPIEGAATQQPAHEYSVRQTVDSSDGCRYPKYIAKHYIVEHTKDLKKSKECPHFQELVTLQYGTSTNFSPRTLPFFPVPTRTEKSSLPCPPSLHAPSTSDFISYCDYFCLNDLGQSIPFFPALIGCCVPELDLMLRDELLRSKHDEIA